MSVYPVPEDLTGRTPLVVLERFSSGVRLLAKLEWRNPAGSVKDRTARSILEDAETRGLLGPGGHVVEATSGNTGIALAAACARRGWGCTIFMPKNASRERKRILEVLGARVVDTENIRQAVENARSFALETPGAFYADQFHNPANPAAHRQTGREIWEDTGGAVDIFVAGIGTGGTITGAAEYLKARKDTLRVIGVEPAPRNRIEGIGPGFPPPLLRRELLDDIAAVDQKDAMECCARLARTEGLLAGPSGGAVLWAALRAARAPENGGKTVVALLPDAGERYLSDPLYARE